MSFGVSRVSKFLRARFQIAIADFESLARWSAPLALLTILSSTYPAKAALENENLISPMPNGFKIGYSSNQGQMMVSEFVPNSETVDNWSTMITVQVFHGLGKVPADDFAGRILSLWKPACPGGDGTKIKSDIENGYSFSLWLLTCPLNPKTAKPENMWLKVIQGRDSLYAVQYAYRKELVKELIGPATNYLKGAMVCDTRLMDRVCPMN